MRWRGRRLERRTRTGIAEGLRHPDVDVRGARDRLVRRREQIGEIRRDPRGLVVGEILEILLAAENGDRHEIAILVFDDEVGDEPLRLADIFDVPLLQRLAHLGRRFVQGIAADDGVDRFAVVFILGERRCLPYASRGEQTGGGRGPGPLNQPRKPWKIATSAPTSSSSAPGRSA